MQTSDAYSALVKELEAVRNLPMQELVALAGSPAIERSVEITGQPIELEVLVTWLDPGHTTVRITGHARGPSTWHHEHLQESITVSVASGATNGA
ncbi:conserved hypothetical protein [uncultured Defluviicoccus sp.]|uniref:Uncharacterized protein n=1 Tax=metagenome TaxID=256318 RepID=A0A380TDV9_9ZZZZ|nr:conserved hypothetical protein [uncultured Defluviicoccus sp.]